MCETALPFSVLGWLVVMLQVEASTQSCMPPDLSNGYFYPFLDAYPDDQTLTYACDKGFKPAVEGWWASITCIENSWSDAPLCIEEKACLPPSIANVIPTEGIKGWYREGSQLTCETGYNLISQVDRVHCSNGSWASVPVCAPSPSACGELPQHPHAVVIHMPYKSVFAKGTVLQYGCEDGYTTEGTGTKASITCEDGGWSAGPTCRKKTVPDRSGSSSGTGDTEVHPPRVSRCGPMPVVKNGEVVQNGGDFLIYKCKLYYKLEGSETVWCLHDGIWSDAPVCKAHFCMLRTEEYPILKNIGYKILHEGETMALECVQKSKFCKYISEFHCSNGIVTPGECISYLKLTSSVKCW